MDFGLLEYLGLLTSFVAICVTAYRNCASVKEKRERDAYYARLSKPPGKGSNNGRNND